MTKHVAIVGAGLGGLRAAEQLRAAGHSGPSSAAPGATG
jgi:3-phenylpropionate/trans-cinnamate dioxygenase ferredoxin reductase component